MIHPSSIPISPYQYSSSSRINCSKLPQSCNNMSLQVKLISGQLSHDTELLSNMDPYCILQLGSQRFRSKTKKQAGKRPVWNETFTFNSSDNDLKVTVMDEDTFNDDLVGEGVLNVAKYRNSSGQQEVVQLYYKGKTAGKVVLVVSGNGGSMWGNNGNGNAWGQQNYIPPVNPPYIPPVNPYNQPYNQPNMQPQWGNSQPMWQNQPNTISNSPWGDLTQNNGWGNFAPNNNPPNYNPNPINPLLTLGTILNPQNNPYSPPPYQANQYNGNPYQ